MSINSPIRKSNQQPTPNNPGHPEQPIPKIPIPGQPQFVGGNRSFRCKICSKTYNSKRELTEHMHAEHPEENKIKNRIKKLTKI